MCCMFLRKRISQKCILKLYFLILQQFYYYCSMYKQASQNTFKSFQTLKKTKSRNKYKKENLHSTSKEQYSEQVYRKFLKILNARRQRYLKQHLVEYYGKNFPINYREHYQFEQSWQNRGQNQQRKKGYYINGSSSLLQLVIAFLTIIIYPFTIWLTNLDFFYRNDGQIYLYYQAYTMAFFITLLHFVVRILRNKNSNENTPKIIEIIKCQKLLLLTLCYLIAKLSGVNIRNNIIWMIFEVFILVLLYDQASKVYQSIRLTNFSLQYEYQIKVLDMIITVFIVAHFMVLFSITKAIVLYLTTHLSPQNNWMTALSIDKADEYVLYTYSFYFCTTTIMTVGYGDITPKNQYEVTVVILVQIFGNLCLSLGVIVLGYIINQIGYCVSSLRRSQQLIEKDLSVVEKIKKHYKMNASLANKVRQYIVNSKPNINQLSPEEESGILIKLNQQIRAGNQCLIQDLTTQNMLSVVKSSVFFLCRWSKHFQSTISSKLIHVLFNPNDFLYQPFNNERLYIIKKGKIDIYAGYNGKRLQKVLKTINNTTQSQVSDNCYGYTGIISIRKPKIYAISKGFTSAYYIDKQKFKECINEKITDIEYYHQLKTKIDQARLCQSIQINSSQSTKHHYNPTRSLLVKKEANVNISQSREYFCRAPKNAFRGNKQCCDTSMMQQVKNKFMGSYAELYEESLQNDYVKVNTNQTVKEEEEMRNNFEMNTKVHFDHHFESSRQYSNYFVRNNKSEILKVLEKEEFMIKPGF